MVEVTADAAVLRSDWRYGERECRRSTLPASGFIDFVSGCDGKLNLAGDLTMCWAH